MLKHGMMAAVLMASWCMTTPAKGAEVGELAPEIQADRWYNASGPVSLAQFRGQVVVVEFWATYCGPCHMIQPRLAAIHERLAPRGLVLISMSDEPEAVVTPFLNKKPASYILSAGGDTPRRYGIKGIPAAFVIDRNGVVAWRGNPHEVAFEQAIEQTMGLDAPQTLTETVSSNGFTSTQRSFEGTRSTPAKKAPVATSPSKRVQRSAVSKSKPASRPAPRATKTSRKPSGVVKAKSKPKSAKLVKKGPSARKSAKRAPSKRSPAKRR